MGNFSDELSQRYLLFATYIMKFEKQLCKNYSGRHIYGQLFRAGTSAGANYEEARAAESKADFIHKMQLVLKELRESSFWIKLITTAKLITHEDGALFLLQNESTELSSITAKSVLTAKSNSIKSTTKHN